MSYEIIIPIIVYIPLFVHFFRYSLSEIVTAKPRDNKNKEIEPNP